MLNEPGPFMGFDASFQSLQLYCPWGIDGSVARLITLKQFNDMFVDADIFIQLYRQIWGKNVYVAGIFRDGFGLGSVLLYHSE